jgi:hypothetical protein
MVMEPHTLRGGNGILRPLLPEQSIARCIEPGIKKQKLRAFQFLYLVQSSFLKHQVQP